MRMESDMEPEFPICVQPWFPDTVEYIMRAGDMKMTRKKSHMRSSIQGKKYA